MRISIEKRDTSRERQRPLGVLLDWTGKERERARRSINQQINRHRGWKYSTREGRVLHVTFLEFHVDRNQVQVLAKKKRPDETRGREKTDSTFQIHASKERNIHIPPMLMLCCASSS